MDFISVKETAKKWGVSERWVQVLCEQGRIDGVSKFGKSWLVPKNAEKPTNGRVISGKLKKSSPEE